MLLYHGLVILLLSELKAIMIKHMLEKGTSVGIRPLADSALIELVHFSEKVRLLCAFVLIVFLPVIFRNFFKAL